MSVTGIQAAITELTSDDLADLMTWLDSYHARQWDMQIEEDMETGRLNKVLAEVDKEYKTGLAEPLLFRPQCILSLSPPSSRS